MPDRSSSIAELLNSERSHLDDWVIQRDCASRGGCGDLCDRAAARSSPFTSPDPLTLHVTLHDLDH